MFKKVSKIALLAALASFGTMAANAGDNGKSKLVNWAYDASEALDQVMYFPSGGTRRDTDGSYEFRVTVDEEGDILSSELTEKSGSNFILGHARSTVKKMDLPDLPNGYSKLTFAVRLNYATVSSDAEARALSRQPRVTTRQIAANEGPVTAGIRLLTATRTVAD